MKNNELIKLGEDYDNLVNQGKLREAAELLEEALLRLPQYGCELSDALAGTYINLEDFERALTTYENGLNKGIFYSIPPSIQGVLPLEYCDRFKKIVDENNRLKELAQEKAKTCYEVIEPIQYMNKPYPLFIVLHGGGSSIEGAKPYWKSKMLEQFLLAFIQSSEVDSSTGFTWWKRIPQGRKEITECYQKIIEEYPVDTEHVLIGGFSVGGSMAIDVVLNNIISVLGFVGGCPGKPESFSKAKVEEAVNRGVRGVMIGGEHDYYRKYQIEMAEVFRETGFNHQVVVVQGLGHDFPENFSELIDEAITYILEES